MTYQLVLAAPGGMILVLAFLHGILFVARGGTLDTPTLAWYATHGLVGGAAITPLLNHFGW